MSWKAKAYLLATVLAGLAVVTVGLIPWHCDDKTKFLCYFVVAVLASGFKIHLPGIRGTMSVNFFVVLLCVTNLGLPETLAIACTGTILQCVWRPKSRPSLVRVLFNVAGIGVAVSITYHTYHLHLMGIKPALMLVLAACVYFMANTLPVAVIVALTEGKGLTKTWRECYFWSFPYYLVGAAIADLLTIANKMAGWESTLVMLPVLYWVYRSYRLYLERLEAETRHVDEVNGLHLRTIEALAMAIEAKDCTTYEHLRRVSIYALEIAKEFGVSQSELQALQAASLLHDIGKLAIPEQIISKPSRLSQVEFDKMKIHTIIGAEILERIEFPYPVVPIVLSHHERWNGTGYPHGLKGEEIPIGARILATVDCFDALTSDRQYRRALPLTEAIDYVVSQSGESYDPKVVEILARRYQELEAMAKAAPVRFKKLSKHVHIERGDTPAAGFEPDQQSSANTSPDFLSSIAAARQEAQVLFELTHELGNSLSLDETLSVLSLRLKRMCPYDCVAIYLMRDDVLVPEFVNGENANLFSSLRIPSGQGLVGWVAENRLPILNGNPLLEPGYMDDPAPLSTLQSALAVPLEGLNSVVGVLALYASAHNAFTADHMRILSAVTAKIALTIENALKYRQAENCATTDLLTDLPNARSLFVHLDSELARSKRQELPLSLLVCDLDGFKQVNDRFGHLEGNKVLRRVAHSLRDACREYDYVARMGGDEFVIILPNYPRDVLQTKIAALAEAARKAGEDVLGEDLLSLSVGEASYPTDATDVEQLLAEADRRMYKAKLQAKSMRSSTSLWNLNRLQNKTREKSDLAVMPRAAS